MRCPRAADAQGLLQSGGFAKWLMNRSAHFGTASMRIAAQGYLLSIQRLWVSQYALLFVSMSVRRNVNSPFRLQLPMKLSQQLGYRSESGTDFVRNEQNGGIALGT